VGPTLARCLRYSGSVKFFQDRKLRSETKSLDRYEYYFGLQKRMKMGDRQNNYQINPKMRLPHTLQKFATDRPLARGSHHRSAGEAPWAEQEAKGQKIPGPVHKLLIALYLHKNEAKRT
jgi:hypothetical protein